MPKPSKLDTLVASLAADGVVARRRALVERFGQSAFDQAKASGQIVPLTRYIYAHRTRTQSTATRIVAANVWLARRGAISGAAACYLYGIEMRGLSSVSVVVDRARRLRAPAWIRVRHLIEPGPIFDMRGIRLVAPPQALIQAWWDEGSKAGRGLILDAIREKQTDAAELLKCLDRWPRVSRRRELVSFLSRLRGGIHSYLEYLADTTVLNTPDLCGLERQVPFTIDGRRYRVDTFDPATRTAIEFDSAAHHASDSARRRDLERDALLATIGVQTLRFTFEDVERRPRWCQQRIQATIAARRR